jgi:hypothetical protein
MKPQALDAKLFEGTCQTSVRWPRAYLLSTFDSAALQPSLGQRFLVPKQNEQEKQTYVLSTTNIETINPLRNEITRINSAMC